MNNTHENTYKNSGELERAGLEPLPPTQLSHEAKEKIESWGLTEEQIDFVRQFTSQFRYDLCAQKIDRLSRNKAELFIKDGQEFINLPSFYDVDGRLDGECGGIARQWVIQINKLGLIDILNAQRTDENRVVTSCYDGSSKTHFCAEDSNHTWNGLAILDNEGSVVDEVYIDAAFQTIVSKSESGYAQRAASFDMNYNEFTENVDIPVGWVEINGTAWSAQPSGMVVLGASNDFAYCYTMGFVRDKKTEAIIPLIERITAEDESDYFLYNEDDALLSSKNAADVDETEIREIREILDNAKKIEIEKKEPTINRVSWNLRDITE